MSHRASFSDQLRDLILSCGTSRYALARQVGVSESALSRFMAGKQGLTLATLDKLADVLGIEIVVKVQKVPRPAPKGRKKRSPKVLMTKKSWAEFAFKCAFDAHENHFPSRRGVWFIEDLDVLVLYNNNPYEKYPTRRDEELAEFRRRMKAEGIKELAFATYPPEGKEQAGYTYALVIDASQDRQDWVVQNMGEIIEESFKRML
jgi:transcriptional regulator with XRE-family HTH domain